MAKKTKKSKEIQNEWINDNVNERKSGIVEHKILLGNQMNGSTNSHSIPRKHRIKSV